MIKPEHAQSSGVLKSIATVPQKEKRPRGWTSHARLKPPDVDSINLCGNSAIEEMLRILGHDAVNRRGATAARLHVLVRRKTGSRGRSIFADRFLARSGFYRRRGPK